MILNLRCRAPSPSIAFEHRIAEALEIILRKLTQIEGDVAGGARKHSPQTDAVVPSAQAITPQLTNAVACNRSDFSAQGGVENAAAFGEIVERRTQFLQAVAREAARRSEGLV
jgi:hypothetical protein